MCGHDGPMPASLAPPHRRPIRDPYRCNTHIAWPIGDGQHVVVDRGEVLHVGPGFAQPWGIFHNAETVAEDVAEAIVLLRSTIAQITPSQMRSLIEFFQPKDVA